MLRCNTDHRPIYELARLVAFGFDARELVVIACLIIAVRLTILVFTGSRTIVASL